jgi:predicted TIM-barrel fold metal-dependent hydrolase
VLRALGERDLVFDLMARTDALEIAARDLDGHDELTVVVEHTGWPRSADADEFMLWRKGIDALAAVGDHVVCKLSGLAMPLGSMKAGAFRRWIDHAIAAFGVDRCMFASNFPVDGMHGTLDELFTTFTELTAGVEDEDRDKLFAANAERVYRI